MNMWGLNKSKNVKSNKLNNFKEGSNQLSSYKFIDLKFYEDYEPSEVDTYTDIINSFESDSLEEMIIKTIDLGIPVSFVSGFFDVNVDLLSRLNLKREDENIVKLSILNNYIKKKVLLISESGEEFDKLKVDFEVENIVVINNTDSLIDEMEKDTGELTIWITNNMPKDIKENIELLSEHLQLEGVYFIEVGTKKYFKDSIYFDSWNDLILDSENEGLEESISELDNKNIEEEETQVTLNINYEESNDNKDNKDNSIDEEKLHEIEKSLSLLNEELKNYRLLYSNKVEEIDGLNKEIDLLKDKLSEQENLLLNSQKDSKKVNELNTTIKIYERSIESLEIQNKNLDSDLTELRQKYADLEIDYLANKELLEEKTKGFNKLSDDYQDTLAGYNKLQEEIDELLKTLPNPEDIHNLEKLVDEKNSKISGLNEVIKQLRIEVKKAEENKRIAYKELDDMKDSYKKLLEKGEVKADTIDVKVLSDDVNSQFFYFKVFTQPPYFKSFIEGFRSLLDSDHKVLTVIIKEEDELSDNYYGDFRKINILEEVVTSDEIVWLKPSKLMFSDNDSFYNKFDYIIVIDYIKTNKRFIRGDRVTFINVLMNEKEKDLLGIKGMILSGGEQSIVDMRYDKKYEFAKTSFVRKRYMQAKIKEWLNSVGLF